MNWNRRTVGIGTIALALLLLGGWWQFGKGSGAASGDTPQVVSAEVYQEENQPKGEILVHVAGAVNKPGVIQLPEGSRANDAVMLAEPKEEADLNRLNLAQPLKDGQKIMVPAKGEAPVPGSAGGISSSSSSSSGQGGIVNVNLATAAELDTLPGVGPTIAQRIIDYREANGPFMAIEDLKKVSGIGDKMFNDLKEKVTVD